MLNMSSNRYLARVYYHNQVAQEFSGDTLSYVQVKLHLLVSSFASGAKGLIFDTRNANAVVDTCYFSNNL